ncbi:predicted protein [Naegleria gruberi]|uniref:Predicted protein n=1 Tax=Naegleria gruberi TaxID=5762 RepID=D2V5I8_NAEGR|nr:uncharacterized protein NAEGRDRAFT_64093 [Naegleria gruberi]EFC47658.1 predicted protein [Naegleria gruberi]|eukprot:XP_002680402.1 predicted protein [Naegleria gruberi strain NEG-M]
MLNKLSIFQYLLLSIVFFTTSYMCLSTHASSVAPFVGVSSFAGSFSIGDGLPAAETKVENVYALTINSKTGDLYLTDNNRVRKVSSTNNIMSTFAGTNNQVNPEDGQPAVNTPLAEPRGLEISSNGEVYIADYSTCKIKKVSSQGIMTTIAGTGPGQNNDRRLVSVYTGDGAFANETQLSFPQAIAFHPITGELHIAETQSYKIRKITLEGRIATVVGSGQKGQESPDGVLAVNAIIGAPGNIIFDSIGNMYLSDRSFHKVRKVLTNGTIVTIAGNGMSAYNGDGILAVSASLFRPSGLALSSTGELYIAESYGHRIRKVLTNGTIITIAGTGVAGYEGDGGLAVNALLDAPESIFLSSDNYLLISDFGNKRIRKISLLDGTISTIAGDGLGDGKAASVYGILRYPIDVKKGPNGILIADSGNARVRSVSNGGIISTIAGSGTNGNPQLRALRELATKAKFGTTYAITTRSDNGDVYVIDDTNNKIFKISNQDGSITAIIGDGNYGFTEDGSIAEGSSVGGLSGVALNSLGEVIFTESNRIRKILTNGTLVTISGYGNLQDSGQGFSGDGDLAQYASLSSPGRLFIHSDDIYFADQDNYRFRKIFANGTITTIAGTGYGDYGADDILATETYLARPTDIAMNSKGELIISDAKRIRKIDLNGIIVTLAGSNVAGFSGDGGPAADATFGTLGGIYLDSNDDIYVSDPDNHRIRKISLMCPTDYALNGSECIPVCFGVVSNDPSVCSGKGSCTQNNTCQCSPSYYGANCDSFNCSGISSNSTLVCSSHGVCSSPDTCNCENGYYGKNCESFNCFGVNSQNSTNVCSAQGNCTSPDKCNCKTGYLGSNCEMFNCFGVNSQNSSNVCSSQGNCTSPDKCNCKTGYFGSNCESFNCKGIKNSDSSVCSSRGQCISPDNCKCTTVNSYGVNCEFIVEGKISNITATKSNARLNDGSSIKTPYMLLVTTLSIIIMSIFLIL